MGLLSRLTDSLKRTKDQLFQRFEEVVQQADAPEARTKPSIEIDTLDALEEVLISADVGVGATQAIVKAVGARARRGESLRVAGEGRDHEDPRRRGAAAAGRGAAAGS